MFLICSSQKRFRSCNGEKLRNFIFQQNYWDDSFTKQQLKNTMRKQLVRYSRAVLNDSKINNNPLYNHTLFQKSNTNSKRRDVPNGVVTETQLTLQSIHKLLHNDICAIIVPNFTASHVCHKLANFFSQHCNRTQYNHEYTDVETGERQMEYFGVDRVGVPFNSVYGTPLDSPKRKLYYDQAAKYIQMIRESIDPYTTPVDKLRLQLDEIWPNGAHVAKFSGQKMFAGIGRIMSSSTSKMSEEQPHFDCLPLEEYPLDKQLAANVYLSVPDSEGELEVWNVPECKPEQDVPADWRSVLPESVLIKPKEGDLILVNPRQPHAIRGFKGDKDRVTMQCFIGYKQGEPLMFWN
jgi:hypothetical protein